MAASEIKVCNYCKQADGMHMAYCKSWSMVVKGLDAKEDKLNEEKLNDQWKGGSTNIRPSYYAKYKIDPWTFIIENQLGMDVGSVVKYVVRHRDKNGVEDLNKAIKCIEMMKEFYYNEKS